MSDSKSRLVLAAALAAAAALSGCATVAEGRPAPAVRGDAWLPSATKGDDLLAGKWGLVVVLRADSEACAEEIPAVLALRKEFGPKGLAVVGVTASDGEAAAAFAKDHGLDFPVLTDAEKVVDAWGIPEVNRLHTYLVDPPGVVVVQGDLAKTREVLGRYLVPAAKPR